MLWLPDIYQVYLHDFALDELVILDKIRHATKEEKGEIRKAEGKAISDSSVVDAEIIVDASV